MHIEAVFVTVSRIRMHIRPVRIPRTPVKVVVFFDDAPDSEEKSELRIMQYGTRNANGMLQLRLNVRLSETNRNARHLRHLVAQPSCHFT